MSIRDRYLIERKMLEKRWEESAENEWSKLNFKDEYEMMTEVIRIIKFDDTKIECTKKSTEETEKLLAEAKAELAKKSSSSSETVIEIYTKAICNAVANSPELARAYANRSATFFNAGLYEECLTDIKRTLEIGYPDDLKAKLYLRRAKALWGLEKKVRPEVEEAIMETRNWIEYLPRESEKTQMRRLLKEFKKHSYELFNKNFVNLLPDAPTSNPFIKGASDAVKIKYSKKLGRHLVATRDIKVGEVVLVEKAYVSVHIDETKYSYCWYCSKRAWSSIPCTECTKVVFCNETCRDAAWNEFHDLECPTMASLPMAKFGWFDIMALKLTIKAIKEAGSLKSLKNIIDKIKSNPSESKLGEEGFDYNKLSPISIIYNLYNDLKFMQKTDGHKDFPVRSTYLLYVLASKTELLDSKINDIGDLKGNEMATFLGSLILRFMNISLLNSYEAITVKNKNKCKRGKLLGTFASFFNHSCDDNITCSQYHDYLVFRSTCIIKKDEQLCITYGPTFHWYTVEDRRRKLKTQYNFLCECNACSKNWDKNTLIPSFHNQALLPAKRYKVILEYHRYNDYFANLTEKDIDHKMNFEPSFTPILISVLNVLYENVDSFCVETVSSKAALSHNFVCGGY
ncbi:SET and MYND domain-containing protein 4-like [Microplitis mediator]|uniref:SET and MYND domain-containing protein 4-like n=1 Tax=Microplitis mediator TaxID=375433 RepID=UPI0025573E19|nr:SET and MYND domain-containing protein 4-like [Microplitis mediator]